MVIGYTTIGLAHLYNEFLEGYWIGLSDILFEGDWLWTSSQTSPSYTDWSPTSPNNAGHHQDCAMFYAPESFHWNDHYCTVKAAFICEME